VSGSFYALIEQLARPGHWPGKLLFFSRKNVIFGGSAPKKCPFSSAFAADIRGNPKK